MLSGQGRILRIQPMGVPRSAKNDHFMAPVSQNQRQTVEKARLLNTQSKLSIPDTG